MKEAQKSARLSADRCGGRNELCGIADSSRHSSLDLRGNDCQLHACMLIGRPSKLKLDQKIAREACLIRGRWQLPLIFVKKRRLGRFVDFMSSVYCSRLYTTQCSAIPQRDNRRTATRVNGIIDGVYFERISSTCDTRRFSETRELSDINLINDVMVLDLDWMHTYVQRTWRLINLKDWDDCGYFNQWRARFPQNNFRWLMNFFSMIFAKSLVTGYNYLG